VPDKRTDRGRSSHHCKQPRTGLCAFGQCQRRSVRVDPEREVGGHRIGGIPRELAIVIFRARREGYSEHRSPARVSDLISSDSFDRFGHGFDRVIHHQGRLLAAGYLVHSLSLVLQFRTSQASGIKRESERGRRSRRRGCR
jgi:hypothetical protein